MHTSFRKRHYALPVALALALPAGVAATRAQAAVVLPGDGTGTVMLNIPDLPTGNAPRSFMAWVNVGSVPPNGETLAGYGSINPATFYHRSAFVLLPNGQLDLDFQVGYVVSTDVSIATGTWTQLVATYSPSGSVLMYVDGQLVATVAGVNGFDPSSVNTININNNSVTFGYEYSVTNGSTDINTTGLEFQGGIADDSIWDRVLTPAEVLADYNDLGTLPDTDGLLANVFGPVPGSVGSVPEPASFALLAVGFIGLATIRIRRAR